MNKLVAVTGGSGYIAGFVIVDLLNSGYAVRTSLRDIAKFKYVKEVLSKFVQDNYMKNLTAFEADLNSSNGWQEGFRGVDGIFHVASPLGTGKESAEELISIAKGGTLNILEAAKSEGITRIVMTSSGAACTPHSSIGRKIMDEEFWSDEKNPELDPYRVSKITSERAAWEFASKNNMKLTTILPGAVFGPIMSNKIISTNTILLEILNGGMPAVINVPLEISDVRDLATLHRLAFENDNAIGERFLASSQIIKMPEIAGLYKKTFPDASVPTTVFPDFVVRILAKFVPKLRAMIPMLGRQYIHTTKKAETILGWKQHTPQETVIDAACSLEGFDLIKRKH